MGWPTGGALRCLVRLGPLASLRRRDGSGVPRYGLESRDLNLRLWVLFVSKDTDRAQGLGRIRLVSHLPRRVRSAGVGVRWMPDGARV